MGEQDRIPTRPTAVFFYSVSVVLLAPGHNKLNTTSRADFCVTYSISVILRQIFLLRVEDYCRAFLCLLVYYHPSCYARTAP